VVHGRAIVRDAPRGGQPVARAAARGGTIRPASAGTVSTEGFALTKIQPPRIRAGLIERAPLEARLAHALAAHKLVLLCAPAGFGKTAALTRAIGAAASGGAVVAWVTADEDDDLRRLLSCLVAALEPFDPPWRMSPQALIAALAGSRAERRRAADDLLNTLAATEVLRGLIVLDDLHRIEDPAVFDVLELLIERLPAAWCVVIASRTEPPLPLARWRAAEDLADFREHDLRFRHDEVARLGAAVDGASIVDADIELLLSRTGGWVAGLRLALRSLQSQHGEGGIAWGRAGGTMDRHVFDYLASEVLDEMPAGLRDFLLRCSVLPELRADRCAAVSGDATAMQRLADIERRGLFVSVLDEREPTLRLHDLFRDFLDDRLRRDHPQELPALLQRAAASETDPLRRMGYLLRAGAWDEAEHCFEELGTAMLATGAVPATLRLWEQFPAERRHASGTLQHLRGLCAWGHWDWFTMRTAMHRSAALHAAAGRHDAARRAILYEALAVTATGLTDESLALIETLNKPLADEPVKPAAAADTGMLAMIELLQSWHCFDTGALDRSHVAAARMVDLLQHEEDAALWYQCIPLPPFIGLPGMRPVIERYVDGALRRAGTEPPTPLRLMTLILQAGNTLWAGRLDEAAAQLRAVQADCHWLGHPPNVRTYLHTVQALALALRGERDEALASAQALIDMLEDERSSGRRQVWAAHFLFFKARIAAALDDDTTMRQALADTRAEAAPNSRAMMRHHWSTLSARLAASEGRVENAIALYRMALAQGEAALDLYGQASELRLRLAGLLLQAGRPDDAAAALRPALARGAASGECGGALMAGATVLGSLAAAPWADRLAASERDLLHRWAGLRAGRTGSTAPLAAAAPTGIVPVRFATPAPAAPVLAEAAAAVPRSADAGLSPREREVLARIAAGDSNKLIARAFDLSPHTVKRHVANILDKLGLDSRGQAAAWFRAADPR
jgi:LuxR family maltose regulon positive regulatory protein